MLADFGGDVGVAVLGQLVEPLDRVLRLDDLVGIAEGERVLRPPCADLLPPGLQRLLVGNDRARAPQPHHVLEHMRAIADDRQIDLDVLVDRGRVDVDVDLLRARREGVEPAGDAVVEARADAIIRSQSCIAQLASQVPCMPSMPSHCRSAAGKAPSPISVEVMGKPVSLTSSRNRSLAARPELTTPPPV